MTVATTEPPAAAGRRRAPRGSARRSIVAAATELFARRGYEATSVQDIVAAAEVTKGALYHWFGSKSELLTSIYRELLAEQTQRLREIADGAGPVEERLRAAALDVVEHTAEHADELTVWARSAHLLDDEQAEATRRERRRYHDLFRDLVREGQASGVVRTDLSATVITHAFLSALGNTHTWFHPDGPLTFAEVGHQLVALFLGGLRPPGPEPVAPHPAEPGRRPAGSDAQRCGPSPASKNP
ncbi:TetR family transcriptional regulator [Micromonospora kangleipakensis]|uniref:TetR family transcriptional regulator n=1 Tax=Micromonospora kangleipakensis TaxID=1077942 RepID=A0A4Q8BF50_9ACTN|nr:TetR/AcrR family transcriptional regulator [Micromonospora kangleipakensis]RZU76584.1 TetR family transcriptional regulator [Micromonospora kangleipakensis]